MAYMRERMSRHALACDMFVPQAQKDPPDKQVNLQAGQYDEDVVSKDMTSIMLCSPEDLVAILLRIPKLDPDLPSTSVSPARPNNNIIADEDQSIMLDETINSNAYKVNTEAGHHALDVLNGGDKPATDNNGLPIAKIRGGEGGLPAEAAKAHKHSNERFLKNMKLPPQVPDKSKLPNGANSQVQ